MYYDYFKGNSGHWYLRWNEYGVQGICTLHWPKDEEDAIKWCKILNRK